MTKIAAGQAPSIAGNGPAGDPFVGTVRFWASAPGEYPRRTSDNRTWAEAVEQSLPEKGRSSGLHISGENSPIFQDSFAGPSLIRFRVSDTIGREVDSPHNLGYACTMAKKAKPSPMKLSIDHLPPVKRRELARVVEVIHEEFEDALKGGTADFKKRGRILKIILFGSYARGGWVDEPHTRKGYRSDFDLLIVVNNRKLADFATYWNKAADRLMRLPEVKTPVSFIVHSRRDVNAALKEGQYFFVDIRRDGIVLYELDDEPLAQPSPLTPTDAYETAKGHFEQRFPAASEFYSTFGYALEQGWNKRAAFLLHQAVENIYACVLLTLTNYSPPSHNLKFLRALAEDQAEQLADVWPRDQQRFIAWFNIINEAYVKARYSPHYEVTEEVLTWLSGRANELIDKVDAICRSQLQGLKAKADEVAAHCGASNSLS